MAGYSAVSLEIWVRIPVAPFFIIFFINHGNYKQERKSIDTYIFISLSLFDFNIR